MHTELGILDCIGDGWERYKVYLGLATGTYFLYLVICVIGTYMPIVKHLFSLFVSPALMGGISLFFLNVARAQNPRLEDMFEGFRRYGPLFWLQLLAGVVMIACMIPSIITLAVFWGSAAHGALAIMIGVTAVNAILMFWYLVRYSLVFFILMDDRQIRLFDALSRSVELTKDNIDNLFLLGIVTAVICVASLICLIIPFLFAAPATQTAIAIAYLKLQQYHAAPMRASESPGLPPQPMVS